MVIEPPLENVGVEVVEMTLVQEDLEGALDKGHVGGAGETVRLILI
jgi:hypothetical protein